MVISNMIDSFRSVSFVLIFQFIFDYLTFYIKSYLSELQIIWKFEPVLMT